MVALLTKKKGRGKKRVITTGRNEIPRKERRTDETITQVL